MAYDPLRNLRLGWNGLGYADSRFDRSRGSDPGANQESGPARFIGRVFNAGSIPSATEKVFLVNPIRFDGPEIGTTTASVMADPSRAIPVLVVGSRAPRAGELLIVHSSGGRWVSEFGGQSASIPCDGCNIPRDDLTLTLTSGLASPISASMRFNGIDEWITGCVNQIIFRLTCHAGGRVVSASHYVGGSCPTGHSSGCSSAGSSPIGLVLAYQSCDPFILRYATTSCSTLADRGFSMITITR